MPTVTFLWWKTACEWPPVWDCAPSRLRTCALPLGHREWGRAASQVWRTSKGCGSYFLLGRLHQEAWAELLGSSNADSPQMLCVPRLHTPPPPVCTPDGADHELPRVPVQLRGIGRRHIELAISHHPREQMGGCQNQPGFVPLGEGIHLKKSPPKRENEV